MTNLCIWSKLTDSLFIKRYCRWVPYYDNTKVLCLKETDEYDCILWKNGCTAYDKKPVQCTTYPFWSHFLESERAWNENEKSCPGINKGQLHTKEEIERQLALYENNEPLRPTDFAEAEILSDFGEDR